MLSKTKSFLAKLSKAFPFTAGILFVILIAVIASDLSVKWIEGYSVRKISGMARLVANFGIIAGTIAVSYYIIRTIYTMLKSRSLLLPVIDAIILTLIQILRPLHTTVGALAVFFLSLHGYMFIFRVHLVFDDKVLLTGLISYTLLFILAASGLVLSRHPHKMNIRIPHRVIALIMAGTIALHLIFQYLG